MLAAGVVAGGSVAGVMVTPPPLPHAPLRCCHRHDAAHRPSLLPPILSFLIGLFFFYPLKAWVDFTVGSVWEPPPCLRAPPWSPGSPREPSMPAARPKGVMTSSLFLPMADLSGRDVMIKNIPPSR